MQPLEKSLSISQSIVIQLTETILSGDLPGGSELTQEELAETFGVSRMPVRDAISRLERRGLLERLPNRHVRVSPITGAHVLQIFAMIALCQAQCLEDLAQDPAAWQRFTETIPSRITADTMLRFHRTLAQSVACAYLCALLTDMVECFVRIGLRAPDTRCTEGFRQYLLALAQKDLAGCRRALREHCRAMGDGLIQNLPRNDT